MAKQMNLIPLEIKQKRRNNEYKKIGAVLSLVPIGLIAQGYLSIMFMQGEIQEINSNISKANNLEQQMEDQQKLIEKNRSIIINLTSGGLPLNQFLLFTGINLPEDIRLYSISSENAFEDIETEEGTEGENTENNANQEVNTETGETSGEESEQTQEESVIVEQKKNNIPIKGAALNVDSIGNFMSELENKNDYIQNVDIIDVQNYYNGAFNYKLFELVVELKN